MCNTATSSGISWGWLFLHDYREHPLLLTIRWWPAEVFVFLPQGVREFCMNNGELPGRVCGGV